MDDRIIQYLGDISEREREIVAWLLAKAEDCRTQPKVFEAYHPDRIKQHSPAYIYEQIAQGIVLEEFSDSGQRHIIEASTPSGEEQLTAAAELFCRTPLPDSVCADLCATKHGQTGRTGTNLLTVAEAKEMLRPILALLKDHPHA